MFVSDWMTRRVLTVAPDDYLSDAISLMREKGIRHLPVVKAGKLAGIVSDRDIKEYCPSKATALDIYELHYLLANTRVKEAMRTRVLTTAPDTPVEEAALRFLDDDIGCLPVLDGRRLVGIVSDKDVYRALVDITGIRHGGHRVCVTLPDRPGSIRELADIIREQGFRLQGILTSYEGARDGWRRVVIRTKGKGDFAGLKREVGKAYRDVQIRKG
jgi:acetoin utilization protein AcuB